MPKEHRPRRGSLGFVRKRARRIYPRVSTWPKVDEVKLLGFPVYKVGMLTVHEIGIQKTKPFTYGLKRAIAATALEAPPIKIMGIRIYKLTTYGLKTLGEAWIPNFTDFEKKYLARKVTLPKKLTEEEVNRRLDKFEELIENGEVDVVRAIVRTRPELTKIGKKKPEVLEIQVGGPVKEAFNYLRENLGKEINISDVFSTGEFVDVIGVTKGKGFQGVVKRFGVKKLPDKSKKEKRAVGSLGPWTPGRVMWTVPRYGQLGFFKRTEYNKQILAIIKDGEEIKKLNPKGGWPHYGIILNPAVVIRGSAMGPPKRLLLLRKAIRPSEKPFIPKIVGFTYSREVLDIDIKKLPSPSV
mgnify:CR=1 FL=1